MELNPFVNWVMSIISPIETMLLLKVPFLVLLTYVVYRALKKTLNKREIIYLRFAYIFLISFYSFIMYRYNLPDLLQIVDI